ncbi:MAG TPA: RNA polymerase sigma factor [Vitreimonas sp.]|jgi:RNA polymerase sigma factor (sigma-70 family)|nr:RNA polymerase sigma factor [Vitreimonas sp.]
MGTAQLRQTRHDGLGEAELVRLAQAGERDAFRVIMQRGNQRLFRIARSVVRDEAEAEDVVQEAYVRAFAAIGGFRGEAGVMTWLTRITLNEARGRLRRRRPMVGLGELEAKEKEGAKVIRFPLSMAADNPEADAARAQIRQLIERAVDELPESFRLVFIMREIEECSVEETAASLELKPETVKTRLHRARRLLRKALEARLATTLTGAFPFLGARCERITTAVLERLAAGGRLR